MAFWAVYFFSAHSKSIQLRRKLRQVAFRTICIGFRQSATSHSQQKVNISSIHALMIHLRCARDVFLPASASRSCYLHPVALQISLNSPLRPYGLSFTSVCTRPYRFVNSVRDLDRQFEQFTQCTGTPPKRDKIYNAVWSHS
jgi:hypothetical protein